MNQPDPSPHRSEKEIFFAALEKNTPEERGALLDAACGPDPARRARLEALLADHFQTGAFMKKPAVAGERPTVRISSIPEVAGITIGRYKLLQQIGEGGCGVVYMAEQQEPVRRRVALKVIKLGMDTKQVIARFEAERQALALMDHANIAKVFDAGATEAGRPYFVMELVKGIPITRYCDEHNLSTAARLGLFLQVCQAIQHAHQKGIIHRDIKPSNILVADHDGVPVPKIIDFGIAKATTDQQLTDKTLFTAFEQFIGTPAYMSPEQANLSGLDIDTRSDIYSLGVLLYELLTGKTPFEAKRLVEAGLDEIRRIIREEEPTRPSTRLHTLEAAEQTTVARHRQSDPPKLAHLISGDLDWIVMKALEKDRARRYETANGLAADVQRHLNNEPVLARPPGRFYRLQKMARRNRLVFAALGAVAVALLAGLGLASWALLRERLSHVSEQRSLYGANLNLAQQAWEENNLARLNELLTETRDFPDRGFEWYYWERQTHLPLRTIQAKLGSLGSMAFSSDGQRIVAGSYGNIAKVWDAATGRELLTIDGNTTPAYPGPNSVVAFSPDGRRIVTGLTWGGGAKVWDAGNGRPLLKFGGSNEVVTAAAFSPDGRRILLGGGDERLSLWDAASGQQLLAFHGDYGDIKSLAFSPDGRRIVTGSQYAMAARIWDAANGRLLLTLSGSPRPNTAVAFSPDSQKIVTGVLGGGVAAVWDAASGRQLLKIGEQNDSITAVAISPDGRRILTGNSDYTAKLWDATNGGLLLTFQGHSNAISSVAFSPDGQRMVTASADGMIKVWDESSDPEPLTIRGYSPAFCPGGQRIVIGGSDQTVKVLDAANGRELCAFQSKPSDLQSVAISRDGQRIVTASRTIVHGQEYCTAAVWDGASGRQLFTLNTPTNIFPAAAISPDGERIVTGSLDNSAAVWDAGSGGELLTLHGHTGKVCCMDFSRDGRQIVTGSWDWTAKVWDAATGHLLATLGHNPNARPYQNATPITAVAFSPDGQRIATADWEKTACVWDISSGRKLLTLRGHRMMVASVAFSPDGRRIITGSFDATAKLWDAVSGRELLTFKRDASVYSVAFSPDGLRIATGSSDGVAMVWRAARPEQAAQWQAEDAAASGF